MTNPEQDLYTYYNWQFLRRSLEYRKTYDEYAHLLDVDEPASRGMLFHLVKRWGMSSFIDWRIEKPDFPPNLYFDPIAFLGLHNYEALTSSLNPIGNFIELQPGDQKKERFLLIAVDLERVRAKDYDNFWGEVKLQKARLESNRCKDNIQRVTSDPKHLDVILATYDEKEKNPKANSYEIAEALFDLYSSYDSTPSQHSIKVEENLERANQLIAQAPNILFDFSSKKRRI